MAKRKNGKRNRWKARGRAVSKPSTPPLGRLEPRRGRPKFEREIGPTPETLAKLQCDTLDALLKAKILSKEEATAGREILDAWELITDPVAAASSNWGRAFGRSHVEGVRAERLQRIWRHWADQLMARTHVRCFVVVEWIMGRRACDQDQDGAAGVLQRALAWWLKASAEAPKPSTSPRRSHEPMLMATAQ